MERGEGVEMQTSPYIGDIDDILTIENLSGFIADFELLKFF